MLMLIVLVGFNVRGFDVILSGYMGSKVLVY